jgi:hypothetical protein
MLNGSRSGVSSRAIPLPGKKLHFLVKGPPAVATHLCRPERSGHPTTEIDPPNTTMKHSKLIAAEEKEGCDGKEKKELSIL